MPVSAPFDARGAHRALGAFTVEVEGGLVGLHYAAAGQQGSLYWPRAACALECGPDSETMTLHVHSQPEPHAYHLAPRDANAADAIQSAIESGPGMPEGGGPRRPVTMDHQWPYAEPWASIRRLVHDLARPAWLARMALPFIAPYAWLRLRREARQHAPEAIEGFRLFAAGDFPGARGQLRAAIEQMPEDYDAFYLLLHAYLRQFQFDEALACAAEFGMETKMRASHIDNDIRLLTNWREEGHDPLLYRETKDREGIGLIGQWGEAMTMLRPAGKVRVGEREFSARTDGEFADRGARVEVVGWDGVSLLVMPAHEDGIE